MQEDENDKKLVVEKNKLKIIKQNLNNVNDYFLNFQQYYEIIKKYYSYNKGKKIKGINSLDSPLKNYNKYSPYNKLRKDINDIYNRVYTESYKERNRRYFYNSNNHNSTDRFESSSLFNQENIKSNNFFKNSINLKKNIDNSSKTKVSESVETFQKNININNPFKTKNKTRNKIEYGSYAMNNTNFNHPQLYILKIKKKNILPKINYENNLKITKTDDLSHLIPQNTRKLKVKNNFYNYYIGLKRTQKAFNI